MSYINVFVLIPSFYWYAYLVIKILGSKVTAQKVSKIALFWPKIENGLQSAVLTITNRFPASNYIRKTSLDIKYIKFRVRLRFVANSQNRTFLTKNRKRLGMSSSNHHQSIPRIKLHKKNLTWWVQGKDLRISYFEVLILWRVHLRCTSPTFITIEKYLENGWFLGVLTVFFGFLSEN